MTRARTGEIATQVLSHTTHKECSGSPADVGMQDLTQEAPQFTFGEDYQNQASTGRVADNGPEANRHKDCRPTFNGDRCRADRFRAG